jgi:hypothetical protein
MMVKRTFLFSCGFFFSPADFSLHINLFTEMNIRKSWMNLKRLIILRHRLIV